MTNSTQNTAETQTKAHVPCLNDDLQNGHPDNGKILTAVDAALAYSDAGLSTLPIKPDGSKAPALSYWTHLQERLPLPAEIRCNFRHGCGLAVIGGRISGNLEILDFDAQGLYEQFAVLCADHGLSELLERLPLVETPSGGHHLYYRCETPVEGNQKLATFQVPESTPKAFQRDGKWWKCLIETRGEGGYAITYPTPADCHPDQRPYQLLRGSLTVIPVITAEQRATLLNLARAFNEYVEPSHVVDASSLKGVNTHSGGLRPGDDYNQRGDYQAVLKKHGWQLVGTLGVKSLWRRPDKVGPGISATSNHAGSGLFYVFSTNAGPFESMCAYSPFAVYALLEHDGDYVAAAAALAGEGYGEQLTKRGKRKGRIQNNSEPDSEALNALDTFDASLDWPAPPDEAAFYGLAGDIVRAIEPHTEADPMALLSQFLTFFGNALGRTAHFKAERDKHYPNLFVVLVGTSAKGRKGTSMGHILDLFHAVDEEWVTNHTPSGLSSGEGLIWEVRDPIEKQHSIKKDGRVTGYEMVIEDKGVTDKRLMVIEEEFGSPLKIMAREGNTLSPTLRRVWNTGDLQVMTKNNPAKATGAHISIVGHITKNELLRHLNQWLRQPAPVFLCSALPIAS
jgi:hypothetical protein